MEWKAITYIAGPITLVAFIGAIVLAFYRVHVRKDAELIKTAPEEDRGGLIEKMIRVYDLKTETLRGPARERIALEQLKFIERRYRNNLITVVVLSLIFATMFTIAILNDKKEPPNPTPLINEEFPIIKEDALPGFDVESVVDEVDLRERVPLSIEERRSKKSKAIRKVIYRLTKTSPNAKYFLRTMGTSGLEPDIFCDSHQFKKRAISDEELRKTGVTESLKGYQIAIDIQEEPVDKPFDVILRLIYWNGFQGESRDWTSHNVLYPTRLLTFRVIFPRDKPYTTLSFSSFLRVEQTRREVYEGTPELKESLLDNSKVLEWTVKNPKTNYAYRIDWEW